MSRRQRVELKLPEPGEEPGLPSSLLMYKPGTGEVYRLTNTGTDNRSWHTFELASCGGHRFNQPTALKATEGLVACPVGTVVRIVVEEE